jgi:TonB family protein
VASAQLLFLTKDRTKKEVVCQVVKSKNYSRESGYVELEFTESAPGFWGMRFPTAGVVAAAPVAAKLAVPVSTLPEKLLQEKLTEQQAKPQAVQPAEPSKSAEVKPVEVAEAPREHEVTPVVTAPVSTAKPVVAPPATSLHERLIAATTKAEILPRAENPKQAGFRAVSPHESTESAAKLPTLSEFLTQSGKGPELRPAEKEKSPTAEQSAKETERPQVDEEAVPQAQLSALIFQQKSETPVAENRSNVESDSNAGLLTRMLVPEKKEAESNVSTPLAAKANPAPGTSTFDFGAEEVKIPAWLEPLARNSPASAAVFEMKSPETKTNEANSGATFAAKSEDRGQEEHETALVESGTEYSERHAAVLTLSSEGPTPNFGSSLALDTRASEQEGAGKSRKGLVLVLLAAGLLLAAAAVWYWYKNQSQTVSASEAAESEEHSGATPVPGTATPVSRPAGSSSGNYATIAAGAAGDRTAGNPTTVKGDSNGSGPSGQHAAEITESTPEPAAKPTLGKVHLTAPLVNHSAKSTDIGAAEVAPTLNETGEAGGDPGSLGLLASKGKQPAAPLVVGGDVKQARLISSVAPVYPQLARNQRLSGDVTIDALVDVHGNLSTVKVTSGPPMLHQAAMDALRQWKYQPATLNGQAMAMHLSVTVQFKLQ